MEIISLYPRGAVVQEWKWQGRRGGSVTMLPAAVCHIKISSSEVYLYFPLKVIAEKKKSSNSLCQRLKEYACPCVGLWPQDCSGGWM